METRSLNVGCGSDPWGDVRVDVAFEFIAGPCNPNVLADAHFLPFKDNSFDIVKCSHVLEHLKNPFRALDEMVRVARNEIILRFPTEWDVLPLFISNIFPPSFSVIRLYCQGRKKRLHLWIVKPEAIVSYLNNKGWECKCEKNTISFFNSLVLCSCRLELCCSRSSEWFRCGYMLS